MKTRFSFGKDGIEVPVSDRFKCQVLHSRTAPALANVETALGEALDRPIGSSSLTEIAAGKKTAAISACDITRPAPNRITLPPLLKRLHAGGVPMEGIAILIATGLHRAATKEEEVRILGPEIAAKYRVASHDARALDQHRWLGTTRRGTPVYIDERFMAADLHITLGFIEQHLMLGFSGGRKLIAPGQAAQETIKVIHSPKFMEEPRATEGSIAGNPLHDELLEVAAMARHDFILDVTLTKERQISGIFAGDPVKAHAAGVDFIERTSLEELPEPADAVITSAAGYPLDLTLYQVVKGVTAASHIVKPGGRILILGECAEGVGSEEFASELKTFPGHRQYLDRICRSPQVEIDQWQLEKLAQVGVEHEVLYYIPGVKCDELGSLGPQAYQNVGAAIDALTDGLPSGARIALVPDGPYTYARAMSLQV